MFGVDKSTVLGALHRRGVQMRTLRAFTDEQESAIIARFEDGENMSQIARDIGTDSQVVRNAVKRKGGKLRGNQKFVKKQDIEISKLYDSGMTIKEIEGRFDCGYKAIRSALKRTGSIEKRKRETIKRNKKICNLYKDGCSLQEIADMLDDYTYGAAVGKILKQNGVKTRDNRKYQVDHHCFDNIDNEHTAYWLGFIYADGCVVRNQVKIGLHKKDIDHLKKFISFCKAENPIHSRKNVCQVSITSKIMSKKLKELGIIAGRNHFHITKKFIPSHLEHHFLRGLFDGDGCFSTNMNFVITCRKDILEWAREKICANTNAGWNKIRKRRGTSEISWGGNLLAPKILRYIYNGATIWLDRKYERAKKYL